MLSLSNIYVQYGNRILLDGVNFVLKPGEKFSTTLSWIFRITL